MEWLHCSRGSACHCPFLSVKATVAPTEHEGLALHWQCHRDHYLKLLPSCPHVFHTRPPHSSQMPFIWPGVPEAGVPLSHEGLSTGLVFRNTLLKITVTFINMSHLCLNWAQLVLNDLGMRPGTHSFDELLSPSVNSRASSRKGRPTPAPAVPAGTHIRDADLRADG